MLPRILTAIVGIPIFLGALLAGDWLWALLVLLLAGLAGVEMGRLLQHQAGGTPSVGLVALGSILFVLAAYTSSSGSVPAWEAIAVALLLVSLVREVLRPGRRPAWGAGGTLLGALYTGGLFAHLVLLRNLPEGLSLLLLTIIGTWASDSGAFFVGRAFGRRRLAPEVSPKKTWEGAVGGVFAAALAGVVVASQTQLVWVLGAVLGAVVAVAGQMGDLAASAMKREAGVKDTGTLLPGHGGVIDRFDSLLFAGAVVYYSRLLLGGWLGG